MVRTNTKAAAGMTPSVAHAVAECAAAPVRAYKNQALNLLKITFPRISVAAIRRALVENGFLFTPSFDILYRIELIVEANEDEERALILAGAPFLEHVERIVLKHPRQMQRPRIVDPTLVEEVHAIPEMNKKENRAADTEVEKENRAPDTEVEKENRAPATRVEEEEVKEEVPACEIEVTCECCYGDSPSETMIQCDQGKHFFCPGCVEHYVTEQLFGQDTSIVQCMSSDGCNAGFSTVQMGRALPDKLRKAYNIHQTCAEVAKANIEDICQCPKCGYQVILPEEFSNLPCPVCLHVSCRLCKKALHELQTCKEAAEKKRINARARVEDAMTAAVVRSCPGPGCGKAFFKVEGCNKMTCPGCKTLSCYLCRQEIVDYTHFCQTFDCSHDSCGGCILFTNSEQDDRRARREAGLKELANSGTAAADAGLLISPPPNKTVKTRRRPLDPVGILADNRRAPEPAPIPVANPHAPEQQRALADHVPADDVYAAAPENGRLPPPRAPEQQREIEDHVPANDAYAAAPENGRLPPDILQCIIH